MPGPARSAESRASTSWSEIPRGRRGWPGKGERSDAVLRTAMARRSNPDCLASGNCDSVWIASSAWRPPRN